jgi:hypothetical protein
MPDTPQDAPESPESGAAWLSVSEAAAALSVSDKTVWRRARAGQLTARKVAGGRGALVWEIALESTGQKQPANHAANRTEAPESERKQSGQTMRPTGQQPAKPTGQSDGTEATGNGDTGARFMAHLEAENKFLRAALEQRDRDAAELRAALREALKAMPKALTSGAASGDSQTTATAPEAPTARAISSDVVLPVETSSGAQNGASGPDVSSYGALADWLEDNY